MLALRGKSLFDMFDDEFFLPLSNRRAWYPVADISSDEEQITVEMELPGIDSKNVDISVDGNTLVIKGEKIHESKEKDKEFSRVERYQGAFSRSFTLPSYVDTTKISATYKQGVLLITIPKVPEVTPRQIEIKSVE